MNKQTSNQTPSFNANNQGGNITQAGRDYTSTTNMNFLISFFIIGVLALGGLTWAINFGLKNIQSQQESTSTSILKTNP